jgi:para-nitrobenzyl esterase
MNITKIVGLTICALVVATASPARASELCSNPVQTNSGAVRGSSDKKTNTCVWRGIPYAAAPVGELRWKAPQPTPAWSGTRDALKFGDRCMQRELTPGIPGPKNISEDCLFLNIWRPAKQGKFPVMVWIHGGGYIIGGGDDQTYWGDRLARDHGVVVVTINYRLNIFGFFAAPALRAEDPNHSVGGYGSMDQAFALKWVHDNIAKFGGDPGNVTVFGESAGGWSTCTMLATPLAKGLFQHVVIESGGCEASRDPESAYRVSEKSFKALGCKPKDIACMRKLPARELMAKGSVSILGGFEYAPNHDGHVLTATPLEMIRQGNFNRAAVMIGTNLDEFAGATKLIRKYYFTPARDYEKNLENSYGISKAQAQKLVELYPLSDFQSRPVLAYGRAIAADAALACPALRAATALAGQNAPVFLYRFDFDEFNFSKTAGVFHGLEIPFVFGNLDRSYTKSLIAGDDLVAAKKLSKTMEAYWTNFAKTGDPNGPARAELPIWPRFNGARPEVQVLDSEVRNKPVDYKERCEFWDNFPSTYLDLFNRVLASVPLHNKAIPKEMKSDKP